MLLRKTVSETSEKSGLAPEHEVLSSYLLCFSWSFIRTFLKSDPTTSSTDVLVEPVPQLVRSKSFFLW